MRGKIRVWLFPFFAYTALMNTLFRDMDQATLDLAYNNTVAVADSAAKMADFIQRSSDTYAHYPCHRDISYGHRARQRFDWFAAPHGAGDTTVVFIHGGYWQARSKEDFALVAAGPLAHGFNVVLAEYTLAPEATLTAMVAEIGQLLAFLAQHNEFGGSKTGPRPAAHKLIVAGHSAGGQLAAHYRSHPGVDGVLAISGLFDLEPIRLSYLNQKLALSDAEVAAFSPQSHLMPGAPTIAMVGAAELPELIRHSEDYVRAARAGGENIGFGLLAGHDHYSILEELAAPDGALTQALLTLAA